MGNTISSHLSYLYLLFYPQTNQLSGSATNKQRNVSSNDSLPPHRLQSLPPDLDLSPINDASTPPSRLVGAVRGLIQFLLTGCELLGQGDLRIIGSHPFDAGGFADLWVGERNGTRIAVKSYRYYASSSRLPVFMRLYKEAWTYNHINKSDERFVAFIGVYSTLEHPFALAFEFMEHSNIREYLKKSPDVEKPNLVLDVARGLRFIHTLGIVHANLKVTNVLVGDDGSARIAGFGMAFIPVAVQGKDTDGSFYGIPAPEFIDPWRGDLPCTTPTTKSDIFAFAAVALEVFDGKPLFPDRSGVAGMYSMLTGSRPERSDYPELSDRAWGIVRGCSKSDPIERMTLDEVIVVLETEVGV